MAKPMAQEEKFRMMTETPIPGLVGRLAIPTIISMLVTSFYNMVDTFFVGQIGTSATAAVGVVFPIMSLIQAFGFFCGQGSGNSMSRKLGSKDQKAAEELASTGFYLAIGLGIVLMVLGLVFLEPLSYLLGSTDTILPYTKDYLSVILLGAPFLTSQLVLNNQMRFQGNAFFSMVGVTVGAVLNIGLDPLLMFVFNMGIAGAAWATVISQVVSFVVLYVGIKVSGGVQIHLRRITLSAERLKEIAGGGIPSLFRQGLGSIATLTLNLVANPYGDAAIAAMSVVGRVVMFANSALIGFGQGFQPVCGFNYGAKKYNRVLEAFWFCVKTATGVLLVMAIAGIVFAPQLIQLFRDDPDVVRIGTLALRLQLIFFPFNAWVVMNNMMMQTMGKTLYASILAASRQGLFFIPALLILPLMFDLLGIQMSQAVADVFAIVVTTWMFCKVNKEMHTEMAKMQNENK